MRNNRKLPNDTLLLFKPLCPYCGEKFDAAAHPSGKQIAPKPGDVSVCVYCEQAGVFEPGLTIRRATPQEFAEFKKQPWFDAALRAAHNYKARNT